MFVDPEIMIMKGHQMRMTLLATAVAVLPTLAIADDIEVQTASGPATVPHAPDTIVALDLAAIDTLSALDVSIRGVPNIRPPSYLDGAFADAEVIGTLFEPDFEALAIMAPDLIIAGGRSQSQVAPLSAIAPTIDMTIWGEDMVAQAQSRTTAYGAIFGKEAEAAALNAELDQAIADARAAIIGNGSALILLTNGGKVSAYGEGSRFGWLHSVLGLPEAFPDLEAETHGEAVSFEFIAEVNPDWLIVIDRGAAIGQASEAAAETLDNPLIAGTQAGQNGQIIFLDSARLYLAGGGIQSMIGTIDEITAAFGGIGS